MAGFIDGPVFPPQPEMPEMIQDHLDYLAIQAPSPAPTLIWCMRTTWGGDAAYLGTNALLVFTARAEGREWGMLVWYFLLPYANGLFALGLLCLLPLVPQRQDLQQDRSTLCIASRCLR